MAMNSNCRDCGTLSLPGAHEVVIAGDGSQGPFWENLVSTLNAEWAGTKRAGFLLCNSPYMSRVPVYVLRFLSCVQKAGLHPELYSYLDGVHTLHDGQRPSEFENIGRGVSAIARSAGSRRQGVLVCRLFAVCDCTRVLPDECRDRVL